MRRPPRKKYAPIITKQLTYRILFSATMIVVGTMYIYLYALSDDDMSRREQTMVRLTLRHLPGCFLTSLWSLDIHVVRLPGPRVCAAESGPRMRHHTKQHARHNCIHILPRPAHAHIRPLHAEYLPDGGSEHVRHLAFAVHRRIIVYTARNTTTVRACAGSRTDVHGHYGRVSIAPWVLAGPLMYRYLSILLAPSTTVFSV